MARQECKLKIVDDKIWNNRTRFVVFGQAFLFVVAWTIALSRLIGGKYWNANHNVEQLKAVVSNEKTPKNTVHFIDNFTMSCYKKRHIWFLPHVSGSIIWWNGYFLQLIPSIRRRYKQFHRVLGRVLMVCALAQSISGVGLAFMGNSSTIKIVSYFLATAMIYCVYNAWYFAAIQKDIIKHEYWSMRLVGYSQVIALQRVFMGIFIASAHFDLFGLYPGNTEDDAATTVQVFDDSFVASFSAGVLLTEWYISDNYGWTEKPKVLKTNKK